MSITTEMIRRYFWAMLLLWLLVVVASAWWGIREDYRHVDEMARSEALAIFNKDLAFRYWATVHGGVYVPVTKQTPANEHLSHIPERDLVTPSGRRLTLMNPAYMMRQLHDQYTNLFGAKGRIISLKYLNPNNAPDSWERQALLSFERGTEEAIEYHEIDGEPYLRMLRPLFIKKGCLKCHEKQGYKLGDVRGGVGVNVPLATFYQHRDSEIRHLLVTHLATAVLGFGVLGFAGRRVVREFNERVEAEAETAHSNQVLQETLASLDQTVSERTEELRVQVETLQQTRDRLINAEKMASLGRMVAGFAHELNTPIGVAVGASSLVDSTVRELEQLLSLDEVDEQEVFDLLAILKEQLELSQRNLRKAVSVVKHAKAASTERTSEPPSHFSIKALIDDAIISVGVEFPESRVSVTVECGDELQWFGHRLDLLQLLSNLIRNSVRYGYDEGTVEGEIVCRITLDEGAPQPRLIIDYRDGGRGMDAETLARLYEPFFTTARGGEGTGLGMYFVYNLVTGDLNGTIDCESGPGEGVHFHITLPLVAKGSAEQGGGG